MSTSDSATSKHLRITPLTPPGPDSNYLDWAFVARLYFRSTELEYVLTDVKVEDRPDSWVKDNNSVCSIISQIVSDVNHKHIRAFDRDARGMWENLRINHEDQSSGGRVYWLQKLVLMRMEGDDVGVHIDRMNKVYEKLDALITPSKPLTADDIYATVLVISLPDDWVSTISGLLLNPSTDSATIISALKKQATYKKAQADRDSTTDVTASKARVKEKGKKEKIERHCTFCKKNTHDLDHCPKAKEILSKAKK